MTDAWAVQTEALTVSFDDLVVLDKITLRVAEGTFLAIIGPNGAGKSTLIKVLLNLVRPTSGRAWALGCEPSKLPTGQIGYVPQVKTLDRTFPATAVELVATGVDPKWPIRLAASVRREALGALGRVGAERLADRPLGGLSGGELQRVYLARSLARRPRLILLDEPAAGMDAHGEAAMCCHLARYRAETGATILMITHDWDAAREHASEVLLLNRSVRAVAPPEEAFSERRLREAFGHAPAPTGAGA